MNSPPPREADLQHSVPGSLRGWAGVAEAMGGRLLYCPAGGAHPEDPVWIFGIEDGDFPRHLRAGVVGENLVFPGPFEAGRALVGTGDVRDELAWGADGACSRVGSGAFVGLQVRVENLQGDAVPGAHVEGCGRDGYADSRGYWTAPVADARCTLVATARGLGQDVVASDPLVVVPGQVSLFATLVLDSPTRPVEVGVGELTTLQDVEQRLREQEERLANPGLTSDQRKKAQISRAFLRELADELR